MIITSKEFTRRNRNLLPGTNIMEAMNILSGKDVVGFGKVIESCSHIGILDGTQVIWIKLSFENGEEALLLGTHRVFLTSRSDGSW